MAVLKCKMCGGDLNVIDNTTVAECEYCGSKQTIPVIDNDKKIKLYERANKLRFACEFDKAAMVYESIVEEFADEAEAYWGLVLCKYGIEYVDDPGTGRKVPTCHRSSFDSVMRDENFELVMENADSISLTVYRAEAKVIEEIRKGIIEVSSNEEPYDIFICYKETDENGDRTLDSVLAQDVYEELVEKGYRVFFSRITLEDKIGQEYEPFIFAALNSAKVMLAFGSKYEYYNAVWVKNEWSRFLKLIASGQKKTLIPCYKNLDAYDMPEEFAKLQAQDMGKVGAIQDLLRGIDKIIGKKEQVVIQSGNATNVQAVLKRGMIALEDGEWKKADEFFEEVLNQNAECAEAYLGKLLVVKKCSTLKKLMGVYIEEFSNFVDKTCLACQEDREKIDDAISKYVIEDYLSKTEIETIYSFERTYKTNKFSIHDNKVKLCEMIDNEKLLIRAKKFAQGDTFVALEDLKKNLIDYYDKIYVEAETIEKQNKESIMNSYNQFLQKADEKVQEVYKQALAKKDAYYYELVARVQTASSKEEYKKIEKALVALNGYKESQGLIQQCHDGINCLEREKEEERKLRRIKEEEEKKEEIYNKGIDYLNSNNTYDIENAIKEFERIPGWKDSEKKRFDAEKKLEQIRNEINALEKRKSRIIEIVVGISVAIIVLVIVFILISNRNKYDDAKNKYISEDYIGAIQIWTDLGKYEDSKECRQETINLIYDEAFNLIEAEQYDTVIDKLTTLKIYLTEEELIDCHYIIALAYATNGEFKKANEYFVINNVTDSDKITKLKSLCDSAIEISNLNDGNAHDLGKIYENINLIPSVSEKNGLYSNDNFKEMLSLNGLWKEKDYYTNGYEIRDGAVRWIKQEDFLLSIYYKDGFYFIGQPGEKSMKSQYYNNQVLEYSGANDYSLIIHTYLPPSEYNTQYIRVSK